MRQYDGEEEQERQNQYSTVGSSSIKCDLISLGKSRYNNAAVLPQPRWQMVRRMCLQDKGGMVVHREGRSPGCPAWSRDAAVRTSRGPWIEITVPRLVRPQPSSLCRQSRRLGFGVYQSHRMRDRALVACEGDPPIALAPKRPCIRTNQSASTRSVRVAPNYRRRRHQQLPRAPLSGSVSASVSASVSVGRGAQWSMESLTPLPHPACAKARLLLLLLSALTLDLHPAIPHHSHSFQNCSRASIRPAILAHLHCSYYDYSTVHCSTCSPSRPFSCAALRCAALHPIRLPLLAHQRQSQCQQLLG